jgi:hypothetical protein
MTPLDTSPEIEEMQIKMRRAMTPAQCLETAIEISLFSRELCKAGIQREHPEWTERQIMIELFRLACFPNPLPDSLR